VHPTPLIGIGFETHFVCSRSNAKKSTCNAEKDIQRQKATPKRKSNAKRDMQRQKAFERFLAMDVIIHRQKVI